MLVPGLVISCVFEVVLVGELWLEDLMKHDRACAQPQFVYEAGYLDQMAMTLSARFGETS